MHVTPGWHVSAVLPLLGVLGMLPVACAAAGAGRGAVTVTRPAALGVTLEAELHHAGLVVLRSPTFR